jgi:extradiol dioxygenase family protein
MLRNTSGHTHSEMRTFGVTLTDSEGKQYQTWITTDMNGSQLVNRMRVSFDQMAYPSQA